MSFYYKLKIQDRDSARVRAEKQRIADRLLALREALDEHIQNSPHSETCGEENHSRALEEGHSDDSSRMLRLATWNIREFDSNKFGSRLDESFYYIAEIISRFDLVAIQEVREDLTALEKVVRILGKNDWSFIATDVTEGSGGNRERMVFVYNRKKVWFRNVAGELVLPAAQTITYPHEERVAFNRAMRLSLPEGGSLEPPKTVEVRKRSGKAYLKEEVAIELPDGTSVELPPGCSVVLPKGYEVELTKDGTMKVPAGAKVQFRETGKNKEPMVRLPKGAIVGESLQFARTPAMVAFQCGWLKLYLCTVHIYYGSDRDGLRRRRDEIRSLTKFLSQRAARENDTDGDSFFLVLGDFNIVDKSHDTMKALNTNGFKVPEALHTLPGSNVDKTKSYDQIAFWTDPRGKGFSSNTVTSLEVHRAGIFDFFETVFREGPHDSGGRDEKLYISRDDYEDRWKYRDWRTFQMSDHLPMWIELRVDFGDEYLEQIRDHDQAT